MSIEKTGVPLLESSNYTISTIKAREEKSDNLMANLAISETSRIQELPKDEEMEFEDIDLEVNKTLVLKQSSPPRLADLDLTSLSKVVKKLQEFTLQNQHRSKALARKFVLDTGATRHIICLKAYFQALLTYEETIS